jgi:hypothetical protein
VNLVRGYQIRIYDQLSASFKRSGDRSRLQEFICRMILKSILGPHILAQHIE